MSTTQLGSSAALEISGVFTQSSGSKSCSLQPHATSLIVYREFFDPPDTPDATSTAFHFFLYCRHQSRAFLLVCRQNNQHMHEHVLRVTSSLVVVGRSREKHEGSIGHTLKNRLQTGIGGIGDLERV